MANSINIELTDKDFQTHGILVLERNNIYLEIDEKRESKPVKCISILNDIHTDLAVKFCTIYTLFKRSRFDDCCSILSRKCTFDDVEIKAVDTKFIKELFSQLLNININIEKVKKERMVRREVVIYSEEEKDKEEESVKEEKVKDVKEKPKNNKTKDTKKEPKVEVESKKKSRKDSEEIDPIFSDNDDSELSDVEV